MTTYDALGLRPIINAFATVTMYGGSLMPPEVMQAMTDASHSFVDLAELQRRVGNRIADLTHNEACYVTSGAAAGIILSTAACVALHHSDTFLQFPQVAQNREIIVYRTHRNGYDYGIQQTGFQLIEIDPTADDLKRHITPATTAIIWFQGAMTSTDDLPLEQVIEIAGDVPVIVDAAAQLPPVDNLWNFTQMGASLAIFSGGKDLCGPQSSGLILGRRDLIETIRIMSNPNHGVGRAMKVGKEELMGALAAVERYLNLDHQARAEYCEDTVKQWCDALNPLDGVTAQRDFPNEAGQPLPWCLVTVDPEQLGRTCDVIVQEFLDNDPSIAVAPKNETQFHLNPMTLNAGEEVIVLDACLKLLNVK